MILKFKHICCILLFILLGFSTCFADKLVPSNLKELHYIKRLMDRGDRAKAKSKLFNLMETSNDDTVIAESMCFAIEWGFANDSLDMYDKLKSYYPGSKCIARIESKLEDPQTGAKVIKWDDSIIVYSNDYNGYFVDIKAGLMWPLEKFANYDKKEAQSFCNNYRGWGYSDWRMPTADELYKLHDMIYEYKLPSEEKIKTLYGFYFASDREFDVQAKVKDTVNPRYRNDWTYLRLLGDKRYERYERTRGVYKIPSGKWDLDWLIYKFASKRKYFVIPVRDANNPRK